MSRPELREPSGSDANSRAAWLFSLILDGVCGEAIITDVMAAQGYSRCVARDHMTWNGKSPVVFGNHTPKGEACHSRTGGQANP